ncbi:hypothetical protein HD598_000830 [Neomicrococcus aestuarii]|uniref:Uncharacterized protein n=1 Tax=Neomicrococcus aestuarii TaxID=556325 RepID=A0A7W8TU98_9MICC|nr:hypothetical protein [Neomicrococcus aestuarii]
MRRDLSGRHATGGQGQDALLDPVQAALALFTICGSKLPSRNIDLNRADLREHGLGPGPVTHVPVLGRPVPLVAGVLGNLRLQRSLEHVLRQACQGGAVVRAVKVGADALGQLGDDVFAQARIRAGGTRLRNQNTRRYNLRCARDVSNLM